MALKVLMLKKRLDEKKKNLDELNAKMDALSVREAELEKAIEEARIKVTKAKKEVREKINILSDLK